MVESGHYLYHCADWLIPWWVKLGELVHTSHSQDRAGEDRRRVFTNEIPHQTAVRTEQLCNQANSLRVSGVDSTSLVLRGLPWGTE